MNLHVFNDSHGYNLKLVIDRCQSLGGFEKNIFINLNKKILHKNDNAEYLNNNILSFKKRIKSLPDIDTITLCPLDYVTAYFLLELKQIHPSAKVKWIFWSYEFYHQPEKYKNLLLSFSYQYYLKHNSLLNHLKQKLKFYIKNILSIPVYNVHILNQSRKKVNTLYAFLPQDSKNVFKEIDNTNCEYQQISLISIEQITKNVKAKELSNEIIIGHSARPTGNHAEVLEMLSEISFRNKLFIPLAHGDKIYKRLIKNKAINLFGNQVSFLEEEMEMQFYFKRLSTIGFAIFNFVMQEGLGNILFLLWNGAKIFLRKESNVYIQFKAWGLHVFSLEDDLNEINLNNLLEEQYVTQNKTILENRFNEEKINDYWKPLFQ